jgi:hypothetical protein
MIINKYVQVEIYYIFRKTRHSKMAEERIDFEKTIDEREKMLRNCSG